MTLQAIYEGFLARPEPELLAEQASLHYITTTTSHSGSQDIIKHLQAVRRTLDKKSQVTLNAVEGANSLCLEVETTLLFTCGGGPYLLSLDDNFVVDQTVTIPVIHIVHFDAENKIVQIRQYWDQASLLRKLNVIGSRNNWPISDSVEQKRLISSSIAAAAKCSKKTEAEAEPKKPEERAPKKAAKEPETPLSFFEAQSVEEPVPATKSRTSTFSAKPAPRDYNDLFQGDDEPLVTPPRSRDQVLGTPKTLSKTYTHFEFGEGKLPGDQPVRPSKKPGHFEFGDEVEPHVLEEQKKATEKSKSKHPGHFEFGEAEDCPMPVRPRSSKHLSQWDFEDFVTPEKPKRRPVRGQEVRHFGWSDDEVENVTPKPKPRIAHPRRDAETHFKLQDEQTPLPAEKAAAGAAHNRGLKLYEHNLYDEDEKREEPLNTSNGTSNGNSNNSNCNTCRRKIFDPQWEMKDEFVHENGNAAEEEEKKPVSRSRMGVVKLMDSSWDKFDENNPQEQQPVVDRPIRANPARQSVYSRNWGFGDED
ncbi:conserved hypothetical protein [Trichophyton verrucosum HKI 0517]|uniref:NTF2 domain-containing protein n=1 Tax=Trichophyton verrucosum (strain HKI 0517) TaxID=663202 RepID=D4DBC9_TRIVH|nr:uncharacterized protein TRV_04428 [Trichophyton verrucosum HKI 0517]EFE40837.1 conserved hypothetical protein [Trichophyton verrucosum HKI 0517]